MNRFWITVCFVCGAALLGAALLVPAHFRAVDARAVERAGASTASLIEEGLTLISLEKVGPARLVAQAALSENLRGVDRLHAAAAQFTQAHPALAIWGGSDPLLENIQIATPTPAPRPPGPVVELLMQRAAREKLLEFLRGSRRPGVRQILANRALTNVTHFPPVASASGQALDGAILIAALLFQGDHLSPPLRDTIEFLALRANKGDHPGSLELVYLDLLSLGRRMDWVSLAGFVHKIADLNTLRRLADTARAREEQFPMLFAAVQMSDRPGDVARFLGSFPETGLNDLAFAARGGVGGLDLLLDQQQRVFHAGMTRERLIGYDPFGAWFFAMLPKAQASRAAALFVKYLLLVAGSLCIARVVGVTGGTTSWKGLRFGADTVLALAFAFIVGMMCEPFMGLPSQIRDLPIRFQLPVVPLTPGSTLHKLATPLMNNETSLLPLAVFFVIQALIYVWCLAKLNEIGRQPFGAQMKLRLLENEDHLFDAGLYIGFVGTLIAFIMFAVGISKFSIMTAYSSTSFGIIFVSVLKIFHVRPMRRKLIIETETP